MKRLPIAFSTLFALALFTAAAPTFAQHEQHQQERDQATHPDTAPEQA